MHAETRKRIEHFLWEPPALKATVCVMAFLPVALGLALYPFMGSKALIFLFFALMAPFFGFVYARVGRKVQLLERTVLAENLDPIPALVVNGALQSPGILAFKENELMITPMVGKRVAVPLSVVSDLREVRHFNGSLLLGKRGFWLTVPGRKRLGVAVPVPYCVLLRERLTVGE